MKKRLSILCILLFILICTITVYAFQNSGAETSDSQSDSTTEKKQSDNEKNVMNADQKKIYQNIKKTYNVEKQTSIYETLNDQKASESYTPDHMLIEYNPFGSNTLSLYVYFNICFPAFVNFNYSSFTVISASLPPVAFRRASTGTFKVRPILPPLI